MKLVADERSNSVLISGEPAARLRAKALIAHLDTPQQARRRYRRCVYLHYADAEKLAPKLKEQLSGVAAAAAGTGGAGAAARRPRPRRARTAQIWADPANNALVITAPPKVRRQINDIIDKLDIRRAQVLVEAIIVDVDITKSSELGVNWATWQESNGQTIPGATFLTPVGGASLVDLANAITNPHQHQFGAGEPARPGLGPRRQERHQLRGHAARAAQRHGHQRHRHALGADHGSPGSDHEGRGRGALRHRPVHQHRHRDRRHGEPVPDHPAEEVGTILKVTPQINEGDAIVLKIDIESSSVIPSPAGAVGHHHQQARDHHQCADRGWRHHRASAA